MKSAFFAAALGLLALSASAASAQTSGPLAINVMSTAAFVDNATWNDMFAIQASRLALEKSEDPQIRDFAQTMIREHSRETARLASTVSAESEGVLPPTLLDREDGLLLDKLLLAPPGAEFDRLYTNLQIDRYERAIQLHRAYSVTGDNAALRQLAASRATRARERLNRVTQLSPAAPSDRLASGER
jgi:putative membrane protein